MTDYCFTSFHFDVHVRVHMFMYCTCTLQYVVWYWPANVISLDYQLVLNYLFMYIMLMCCIYSFIKQPYALLLFAICAHVREFTSWIVRPSAQIEHTQTWARASTLRSTWWCNLSLNKSLSELTCLMLALCQSFTEFYRQLSDMFKVW